MSPDLASSALYPKGRESSPPLVNPQTSVVPLMSEDLMSPWWTYVLAGLRAYPIFQTFSIIRLLILHTVFFFKIFKCPYFVNVIQKYKIDQCSTCFTTYYWFIGSLFVIIYVQQNNLLEVCHNTYYFTFFDMVYIKFNTNIYYYFLLQFNVYFIYVLITTFDAFWY